ncbi:chromatin remodeling [Coemansia sp. IMI 209127]|nr:chromatin remodeling [Coemansia sp. IMI 209127]
MSTRSSSRRGSNSSGSGHESEANHVPSKRQKMQDDAEASDAESLASDTNTDGLASVEHKGQSFHVGDHAVLKDTENSSGTKGTGLPAIAQIQSIQREEGDSSVSVTVVWFVFPQLVPHPPYMEFYKNTVLRTFRKATVPVDCITRKCFVVHPSHALAGHPSEWTEADGDMFVCDSLFVDKGAFVQKIKKWSRKFWPATMNKARHNMLTTMVPWEDGPRDLGKAPVPVQANEDDNAHTPQTRRITRMTATPKSNEATPQNGGPTSALSMGASAGQALPQTPTAATSSSQAQLFAYQQLLSQGRMNMPAGLNGQTPPPFALPGANINLAMLSQQQQLQLLQQQQNAGMANPFLQPALAKNGDAIPNHQFQPPPTPKRRGRPPKNKQLIQQRAMEDAAAAAAAAAAGGGVSMGGVPSAGYVKIAQTGVRTPSRPRTPTASIGSASQRQNSMYSNMGRPPPSPTAYNGLNGMSPSIQRMPSGGVSQMQTMYQPNQMIAGHMQNGAQMSQAAAYASQQQQLQQVQQAQQQQRPATVEYLPYTDPSSTPQLPKDVVAMFPTTNGQIKWFAAAPVLRKDNADGSIQHSDAYLSWSKKSMRNSTFTNGYGNGDADTASMSTDA